MKKKAQASEINFNVSGADQDLIQKITERTMELAVEYNINYPWMDAMMDMQACHANGNPMKLAELLASKDSDFAHDVFGIRRHMNRETGKIEGFFLPRFSVPAKSRLVR